MDGDLLMADLLRTVKPRFIPPLDPGFCPAVLANRAFRHAVQTSGEGVPLVLGLERSDGSLSRYETSVFPDHHPDAPNNLWYVERILKFLLWQRGAWKVYAGGPRGVCDAIGTSYAPGGTRAFDAHFMGAEVYQQPFTVVCSHAGQVPAEHELEQSLGRHLDGNRIGFDLGASDLKISAVVDGGCSARD
jgi:hypothetical protein